MGDRDTKQELASLRKENVRLAHRVAAFEQSRWWRLHPRFLLRRATGWTSSVTSHGARRQTREQPAPDPVAESFRAEVVRHGKFTRDWFTANIEYWHPLTDRLSGAKVRVLEVGSFEGLSTCYLLWRLPEAELTCIDTFAGSPEHDSLELGGRLEATFDANVALVDSTRVSKIVSDSKRALLDLVDDGRTFDFIYVDGSHAGLDVIVDAALSWRLLALEGILVFDDYRWAKLGPDPLLRPGPAIDAFVSLIKNKHEVVLTGGQLGLLKTSD